MLASTSSAATRMVRGFWASRTQQLPGGDGSLMFAEIRRGAPLNDHGPFFYNVSPIMARRSEAMSVRRMAITSMVMLTTASAFALPVAPARYVELPGPAARIPAHAWGTCPALAAWPCARSIRQHMLSTCQHMSSHDVCAERRAVLRVRGGTAVVPRCPSGLSHGIAPKMTGTFSRSGLMPASIKKSFLAELFGTAVIVALGCVCVCACVCMRAT